MKLVRKPAGIHGDGVFSFIVGIAYEGGRATGAGLSYRGKTVSGRNPAGW